MWQQCVKVLTHSFAGANTKLKTCGRQLPKSFPGFNWNLISEEGECVKCAFQSLRESRVGSGAALGFAYEMSPRYCGPL